MRTVFISIVFMLATAATVAENTPQERFSVPPAAVCPTEWDILLSALIEVESKGDTLAVGPTNDLGALQITPIYVAEVNRISGKGYTLDDRASLKKSLEMFEIYQDHYNPEKDIDKAIYLHNPGAGDWYAKRVYDSMERIRHGEGQNI